MTIKPAKYDLIVYQGATFNQTFIWKDAAGLPVNLSAYTARMMARTSIDDPIPFINLTTENGGIILGGVLGSITLSMSAANTALLPNCIEGNQGIYDLELVNGAVVTRLLQGNLTVSAEVTK